MQKIIVFFYDFDKKSNIMKRLNPNSYNISKLRDIFNFYLRVQLCRLSEQQ